MGNNIKIREWAHKTICLTAIAILSGCASVNDNELFGVKIEYLTYQTEEHGRDGLIGADGKVLFEPEIKGYMKTPVNGVFAIEGDDRQTLKLYRADKDHEQIGEDYSAAGYFITDIAPVVVGGEPIKFIDKEGNVVFKLSRLNGKKVRAVTNFSDGLCAYKSEDNLWGYIDKEGKSVIRDKYQFVSPFVDGKAFVIYQKTEADKEKVLIIDKKGKVCKELKDDNWLVADFITVEKYVALNGGEGNVINRDGNVVIKKKPKYKNILPFGDDFIIRTDNGIGVMDKDEKIIIRPKYKWVTPVSSGKLYIASDEDNCFLLDQDGKKIKGSEYDYISYFLDGQHGVARDGGEYFFIDTEGKPINKDSYYYISTIESHGMFRSMESPDVDYRYGRTFWMDQDYCFGTFVSVVYGYWLTMNYHPGVYGGLIMSGGSD